GFVGTPPMNFIKVKVQPGSSLTFANQGIRIPNPILANYANKDMVLGIRPESLCPANTGKFAGTNNSFSAKVVVIEPLGDKMDIYLSLAENHGELMEKLLVCRADAHEFGKIQVNDIITLFVDLSRVHVFEPGDNGLNVTLSQESGHAAA